MRLNMGAKFATKNCGACIPESGMTKCEGGGLYLRPAVTLALVLMIRISSLQQRLLGTATASHLPNHGTARAGNDL